MTPTQRILSIFFSFFCNRFFKRIFHDFWLPSGGPKSTQTRLFSCKGHAQERFVRDFCCDCHCFGIFRRFLVKTSRKNDEKKRRVLSRVFLFFATWRTLKFIAMRSVYSTFHFFVFVFFPKNASKIRLKNGPAKVLVTALREAILGPKNPLKSCPGEAQNQTNLEKLVLGEPEFLAVFLKPLFDNFGAKMG